MQASVLTPSSINVGCLVMNVALGAEGKTFQSRQEYIISHSGAEFACKRAKALWNIAILLRNGDVEEAIDVCQENSIKHSPHTGIPKGIEGRVVKRYVEAQRPAVIKRVAAALRWYTSMKLTSTSPAQRQKALKSIAEPSKSVIPNDELRQMGRDHLDIAIRDSAHRAGYQGKTGERLYKERLLNEVKSRIRRVAYANSLKATSKYYSRNPVPTEFKGQPYSSMCMSFLTEPWVPEQIDSRTPCFEMRQKIKESPGFSDEDQEFVGKITFLQEQGCKARVVAQPSAWLQLAFVPLHDCLAETAEELFPHASCARDQVSGAERMMSLQLQGHSLYCTDLSSATDRFPIHYSLGVLDGLGLSDWADALEEVVSRDFKCDESPDGHIRYGAGQPMGLYGSFPLFHLSNMLMANGARFHYSPILKRVVEEDPDVRFSGGSYFLTVGDDIVFSSPVVANRYKNMLKQMGVQTSDAKCYSGDVAEFAGFISTKTNKSVATFRPYKSSADGWINNPLQFLSAMGSAVKRMPRRQAYWQRQLQAFNYTVPFRDIGLESLIPTDDQTLGTAAFRGDTRTMVNLANAMVTCTTAHMPDVSQAMRVSSTPLFRERGMFDYYGYNPDKMTRHEEMKSNPFRQTAKSLSQDPLMRSANDGSIKDLYNPLPSSQATTVPVWEDEDDYEDIVNSAAAYALGGDSSVEEVPKQSRSVSPKDTTVRDTSRVTSSVTRPKRKVSRYEQCLATFSCFGDQVEPEDDHFSR